MIEPYFRAKAHSVTQSSFENPCTGIDGGFKASLRVNTLDIDRTISKQFVLPMPPSRPNSTMTEQQGLVFAFNAPKDREQTFEGFQMAAVASL